MTTLTLDREQRERAHELLETIKRGAINRPTDFLDKWRACPSHDELTERYGRGLFDGPTKRTERWVSLADVAGTHTTLVDTFRRQRLTAVLRILLEGWFQPKYEPPPHYLAIDGELFVGYDGNYRTMVCKAIGVEEIYAKVLIIKVGESVTNAPIRNAIDSARSVAESASRSPVSPASVRERGANEIAGTEDRQERSSRLVQHLLTFPVSNETRTTE